MPGLNVVSLSTVYPALAFPERGIFVHQRLLSLSQLAKVKVFAPVTLLDYTVKRRRTPCEEQAWSDGPLQVFRPAWIYPPGGTPLNAVFLAAALWGPITRLRERFSFDLIDAHFGYPEGIAAAWLAHRFRVPFTVTLRGSELMHAQYAARLRGMKRALRQAGRVIAVSQELGRFAVDCGAPPNRVAVIPNGTSPETFHPQNRAQVRGRLGIPEHSKLVVSAGHLIQLKRHDRVLRAMSSLAACEPGVRLVIAGGVGLGVSSVEKELRQLTARLGLSSHVTFLGHVGQQKLADWMSAADVFCSASAREGWPNVVHEALACGTPVVATRVGAVPELLPAEDYGVIAEVDDQRSLEEALRTALSKTWDREAISRWAQSRSWDQVGAEVFREFSDLLHECQSAARR